MSPPVTVAVVSWNTRDLLDACLRSLRGESDAGRAEVWVIDNGSQDGSAAHVRERFAWAHLIEAESNLGFGRAVNVVEQRTSSNWIAAANADIEMTPGALEEMLSTGEADPAVGAVAPRLTMPNGATQHSVHAFPTIGLGLAFNLGLHRIFPGLGDRLYLEGYWDADRSRNVDWAHGAFLLLRREVFEEIGRFDERQWMYAEDLDLGWRLARAGYVTRYEPRALVRHEVSAATRKAFSDERVLRHLQAAYAWMARRQGISRTRAYALLNIIGAAVRWGCMAPLAALAPRRFARARDGARSYAFLHLVALRTRGRALNPD